MTLVKWNRGNKTNGNNQSPAYQANMPLINSEFGSVLPRLFDTFSRPFFSTDLIQDFLDESINPARGKLGTTLPAVNISETDTDLVIEMAAPGKNKNDFKIEIVDDHLNISYNKNTNNEFNENNHWRREFSFESFERNFALPAIVESEKITATYTDGILRISVPKKEEAYRKPVKTIEIK